MKTLETAWRDRAIHLPLESVFSAQMAFFAGADAVMRILEEMCKEGVSEERGQEILKEIRVSIHCGLGLSWRG